MFQRLDGRLYEGIMLDDLAPEKGAYIGKFNYTLNGFWQQTHGKVWAEK